MKNLSISQLYQKLNKSILLLEAHTEIKNLSSIIKTCRLKPYFLLENNISDINKIKLHRCWFDEFGNSVEITKKNKIIIKYNDLKIDHKNIVCTDLYFGLSIDKITKISKLVHLYVGYENEDIFVFATFLGIDNFIRSYLYDEDTWKCCSPLMLGTNRLFSIHEHLDIKFFLNSRKKNNIFFPCADGEEWISFLPASMEFCNVLHKTYDTDMFNFFNCK